jgi:protein-disulfide isomerase
MFTVLDKLCVPLLTFISLFGLSAMADTVFAEGKNPAFGQPTSVTWIGRPVKKQGGEIPPLLLAQFVDYKSPWTSTAERKVIPEIERRYVKSGRLSLVLMNFPVNPGADLAARVAECGRLQSRFWKVHEALIEARGDVPLVLGRAKELGLDRVELEACLESHGAHRRVNADREEAQRIGVSGVPSFVLLSQNPEHSGKWAVVNVLPGARLEPLVAAIDEALANPPQFPIQGSVPTAGTGQPLMTVHEVSLEPVAVGAGESMTLAWELSLSGSEHRSVEFYYEIEQGEQTLYRSKRRSLDISPGERTRKSLKVRTAPIPGDYTLISELRCGEQKHVTALDFTVR